MLCDTCDGKKCKIPEGVRVRVGAREDEEQNTV